MITLIVPTRNRAHTLRLVGDSFYRQELVSEIIFVDDGGSDDTAGVVDELARRHPHIATKLLKNPQRRGASASRIRGYKAAANDYIMYSDDDIYLEPNYAAVCLTKMKATRAAIVSGRIVRARADQTPQQAIAAFGCGTSARPPFRYAVCEFRGEARFTGDIELPLTGPVILTTKALLETFGYDPYYSRGNGYREESDYQMSVFVNGLTVLVTNDTHCVELSRRISSTGGQRASRFACLYYSVLYNAYFYGKYYDRYAERVGLRMGRRTATVLFAFYQLHALFVRPIGYRLAAARTRVRERRLGGPQATVART
jgi:glycosyltransferase involved in cell wall biosynthesis